MDGKEQIKDLLKTIGGEKINICGEVYEILMGDQDASPQLLQYFFENVDEINSSEEIEARLLFTEEELDEYIDRYGKIVDGILEKLLKEKRSKEEFYAKLWKQITLEELFEDEKAQIFALYYIRIDKRIPYFELPESIHIEWKECKEIIDKLRPKIKEAGYIFASDFEQWTEVSYLLLLLLDEIENTKERAVFLSCIIQIREKMLVDNFRDILDGIAEERTE